jgi:hypothetical protein
MSDENLPKTPDFYDKAAQVPGFERDNGVSIKRIRRDNADHDFVMHEQGNAATFLEVTDNLVFDLEDVQ